MIYPEPYGLECKDGWKKIIERTHEKLVYIDPNYTILQIKEKFGGLRYYFISTLPYDSITYDIMHYVVNEAEAHCARTCELCGAEGTLRHNSGWYKTLCDEHAKDQR